MAHGDFFHNEDLGKLVSSASSIRMISKSLDEAWGFKPNTLPNEFESVKMSRVEQNSEPMIEAARLLGIDELELNAINGTMYEAMAQHEELLEAFKRFTLLVKLRSPEAYQKQMNMLTMRRNVQNQRIKLAEEANEKAKQDFIRSNTNQRKKIEENQKVLESRKQKLIGSINKALEIAKVPSNLSESDKPVYAVFERHKWVGYDGSRFCAMELNIMMADTKEVESVIKEALSSRKRPQSGSFI